MGHFLKGWTLLSGDCFALVVHNINYLSSSLSSQFDDKLPEVQQIKSEIQMMEGNLQPLIEELDSKNLEVHLSILNVLCLLRMLV